MAYLTLYHHLLLLLLFVAITRSSASSHFYELSFPYPPSHRRLSPGNPSSPLILTRAPVISIKIGTPLTLHHLVLDTGSELTWIRCTAPSSSLLPLPCSNSFCNPPPSLNPGIQCSSSSPPRCLYDFPYADSTEAKGTLFHDSINLPPLFTNHPFVLGCAQLPLNESGILGMNMAPLSFPSQTRLLNFSICLPRRTSELSPPASGLFLPGSLPPSLLFNYTHLINVGLTHPPDYDPRAFMVQLTITVGDTVVVSSDVGSTGRMALLDSGSEFTLLDKEGYDEVVKLVRKKAMMDFKTRYEYKGTLGMCFDADWRMAVKLGERIGRIRLGFGKNAGVEVEGSRLLRQVGTGIYCVAVGRLSEEPGPLSIVGVSFLQGHWVHYDIKRRMVGIRKFTTADDCRL